MDIIASILAYLTCVAGIVGAFLVSFYLVFATPSGPIIAEHRTAVANTAPLKVAAVPMPKTSGAKGDRLDKREGNYATTVSKHADRKALVTRAAAERMSRRQNLASAARQKGQISRAQWRWLVEQERARRLAYQQSSDFESRFLDYAD
jgi:hypothetical protein